MSLPPAAVRRVGPDDVVPLRRGVLRAGLPRDEAVFPGDHDDPTFHGAVFAGEALVAVGSVVRADRNGGDGGAPATSPADAGAAWQVRGMATAAPHRGRGYGRAVLRALLDHARGEGGLVAWCNARVPAVAFYESEGWTVISAEFVIPTAGPHVVMERRIDGGGDRQP